MKKIILSLLLIFSFAASILALSCNEANAQGKPTLLYIYMTGCGACQQFEGNYNAAKAKFSQKFNFVKENVNTSQRAKSLNVTETPSVFILDKNGSQRIEEACLQQQSCFEGRLNSYK